MSTTTLTPKILTNDQVGLALVNDHGVSIPKQLQPTSATGQKVNALDLVRNTVGEKRFNSPQISTLPAQIREDLYKELMARVNFNTGFGELKANEITGTLTELDQNIHLKYQFITATELEIAFRNGYQGKYGEYYGINPKTLIGWIEGYVSKERQEALKSLRPETEVPKQELTPEEKEKYMKENLKIVWKEWDKLKWDDADLKTKKVEDLPLEYYTVFDRLYYDFGILPNAENNPAANEYYRKRLVIAGGKCKARVIDQMNQLRRKGQANSPKMDYLKRRSQTISYEDHEVQKIFKVLVLKEYFTKKNYTYDEWCMLVDDLEYTPPADSPTES